MEISYSSSGHHPTPLANDRGCNPKVDFLRLRELYRDGELDLDGMITTTYSIEEAPLAFADMESGINARGVIVLSELL